MIETLRKRFKVGDEITIRTNDSSYTGFIDEFEESCIVIKIPNGNMEFIANEVIKGAAAPKKTNIGTIESIPANEKSQSVLDNNQGIIRAISTLPSGSNEKTVIRKLEVNLEKFKNPKTKGKPSQVFSSLVDLRQLILPEIEAENKKTVPAIGMVTTYFENRNFGFIRMKQSYIWFRYESIIDVELKEALRQGVRSANIPVLFNIMQNSKGTIAVNIQKPKSVEKIVEISNNLLKSNELDKALGVISQILESFPNNFDAKKVREKIENQRKLFNSQNKSWSTTRYSTQYFPNFQKATKAKNIDKDLSESLRLFLVALENNEKRESCIKDIAMLYVAMGEPEKAFEFNNKYESELPQNTTTFNHLQNFYSSIRKFDKVIEFTEKLLNETKPRDKRKKAELLSKKGFSLIQIEKLDEARIILNRAREIYPEEIYANRLLDAL